MSEKPNVVDLGKITEETVCSWAAKYEKRDDGYYCPTCGSKILQVTCYVSLHLKVFEPLCSGPGKVLHINYPFCPKCDGDIDYAQACYHVDIREPHPILISPQYLSLEGK